MMSYRVLFTALCMVLLGSACTKKPKTIISDAMTDADRLRDSLGIPRDAAKVLVFGQNSHLDVDWDYTTDYYYTHYVQKIYDDALDAYAADPEYRYATCEMEYLRRYWNARPERRGELQAMFASGHFKAVGGGVSSPDVLLPRTESLLHDFRAGTHFLHNAGLSRTSTAYLPDDFGLGATTPDVLNEAGFTGVAFWRVDGTPDSPDFNAGVSDFGHQTYTPGTNAARLAALGKTDFMWRSPNGGAVFAHWIAQGYMWGDYLDYPSIVARNLGTPLGRPTSDPTIINANIQKYVDIIGPVSPTDYMFVPIGGDFVYPKKNLAKYARDWNEMQYAQTGVWVVAATFDDFKALALTQKEKLPELTLDIIPYWMGFYATRPELKRDVRGLSAKLSMIEKLALVNEQFGATLSRDAIDELWWAVGDSDHHDWITGTSPDDVMNTDQIPHDAHAIAGANVLLHEQLNALAAGAASPEQVVVFNSESYARTSVVDVPMTNIPAKANHVVVTDGSGAEVAAQIQSDRRGVAIATQHASPLGWTRYDIRFEESAGAPASLTRTCADSAGNQADCAIAATMTIGNAEHAATIDLVHGGALTSLQVGGAEWLDGKSAELVVYDDGGGLYTFGEENSSCAFGLWHVADDDAENTRAEILEEGSARTVVKISFTAHGLAYEKLLTFYASSPNVDFSASFESFPGTMVLARFSFAQNADSATMAVPGGPLTRSKTPRFSPEFMPFEEWFAWGDDHQSTTIVSPANPAITFENDGTVMLVLNRTNPTMGCVAHQASLAPASIRDLTFRIAPHAGVTTNEMRYRDAADLWYPMHARAGTNRSVVNAPATFSFATVDEDSAHITAAYRSDDHNVWVRFERPSSDAKNVHLHVNSRDLTAARMHATEDDAMPLAAPALLSAAPLSLDSALSTWRLSE